ncbi:MAG: phospholipase D family protein [Myxococcales bacterium]|nr:phospholipase D family protein [Myxococcales bacterium]MCB9580121.1 phospholipase D family protein [Polyangiaceae bacterium]
MAQSAWQAIAESRSETRRADVRLLSGADHYDVLVCKELPRARVAVWIATANLKELRIEAPIGTRARARGRYVSILDSLQTLSDAGVEIRLLHGSAPTRPFVSALNQHPRLKKKLALRECPRVHLKTITIDGRLLYLGSANFTGAGLGARAAERRNFELGILTEDDYLLDQAQAEFDAIWSGRRCGACKLRNECPKPLDRPALPGVKRARPAKSARRKRAG